MEWDIVWTCACTAIQPLPFGTNVPRIGIDNLAIQPQGTPDSVAQALARELAPENLGLFTCATCAQRRPRTQTKRIDGAPAILRIKINNVAQGHTRNNNPIVLDPVLDLQQYQAVHAYPAPLKYRLKSVLYHGEAGDNAEPSKRLSGGHWTAVVIDPNNVNHINDHVVETQKQHLLQSNPNRGRQAIVLTYVRMDNRGI
jgi:ubiquitin C-terminal hydrolase